MVEFERLDRNNLKKLTVVAKTYREAFATEPWKEVSRGPACGKFYGPENSPGSRCPCGCGKLEEAYPVIKTVRYIRNEISKPNAIAFSANKDGKTVGFAWAYEETGLEFAETKYAPENREFVANLVGKDNEVIYLSECGFLKAERQKGLGTEITAQIIKEGVKFGLPFLLRTNKGSAAKCIAEKLGMKPIMGSDDTPPDPENPERILFYKE